MDWLRLHDQGLEWFAGLVDGVGEGQWKEPTPCTDWDVRALVNHNVYENLWAAELGAGHTIDEVGDRFDGDNLGDDASAAYRASADAARASFDGPDSLEAPIAVSYGPISGEAYLRHRVMDLTIHGWDLAAATGQGRDVPQDLLEATALVVEEEQEMIRASGVFATDVDVREGEDRLERVLAITGRRVGWTPPA
ncbi:MAG TPA: TIGR03086 family metal-binding protein [Acidimicrobiia bacterium]|nr:TIGR03086 family metal-binding protein [Acidimicrobiia bacterium]